MTARSIAALRATSRPGIRVLAAFGIVAASASLSGCALNYASPIKPPLGALFTDISAPMEVDFENADVVRNNGARLNEGRSKMSYLRVPFFYVDFTWGEGALDEAAQDGNISTVYYADYHFFNVLGIYSTYEVVARGVARGEETDETGESTETQEAPAPARRSRRR